MKTFLLTTALSVALVSPFSAAQAQTQPQGMGNVNPSPMAGASGMAQHMGILPDPATLPMLYGQLGIMPPQEAAWAGYVQAVNEIWTERQFERQQMQQNQSQSQSQPFSSDQYVKMHAARDQAHVRLTQAQAALVAVLTPAQQQVLGQSQAAARGMSAQPGSMGMQPHQ